MSLFSMFGRAKKEPEAPQRDGSMAAYDAIHIGVTKMKEGAEEGGAIFFDEKMCYELDVLALFLTLDVCVLANQPDETRSHIIDVVMEQMEARYGNSRFANIEAKVKEYGEALRDKSQLGDRICTAWKQCERQFRSYDDGALVIGDFFQNFKGQASYTASLRCFLAPLYVSAVAAAMRMDLLKSSEVAVAEAIRDEWRKFEQGMKDRG